MKSETFVQFFITFCFCLILGLISYQIMDRYGMEEKGGEAILINRYISQHYDKNSKSYSDEYFITSMINDEIVTTEVWRDQFYRFSTDKKIGVMYYTGKYSKKIHITALEL